METTQLKWEELSSSKDDTEYRALRISSNCIPELFIAISKDGNRCLLLFLPAGVKIKLNGSNKEKLELAYISDKNVIIIKLNDLAFVDLFDDLIKSLYTKIKRISSPTDCADKLIQSFYKWEAFFEDRIKVKLSDEEIQGLFGELFVLRKNIQNSDYNKVDDFLNSWKGPFDHTNDFEYDIKNIEVKTKSESKPYVKISSEFQLEKEFEKGLELVVVSVIIDLNEGESLSELIIEVANDVRKRSGNLEILFIALSQKGITIESAIDYNNHRFIVTNTTVYDCTLKDFPKLSNSNIPEEISGLKYNLTINSLRDFIIDEIIY